MTRIKVHYEKETYPYSVGAVVESLQGAGLATDLAIKLATDLEKAYRKERVKEIRLEHLIVRLGKMIEKIADERTAQRFKAQTPPFIPIAVMLKEGRAPFSCEVLSIDLQNLGLGPKEAAAISAQIEQSLRSHGYQEITTRELVHWVAMYLDVTYGRELRHLFETQQGQPTAILVVEPNKEKFPFSRGILAQSLIATDSSPKQPMN
jgi:2-phosphoglycerate kinase